MRDEAGALARVSTLDELRAILDAPEDAAGASISVRQGSLEMNYFVARSELERGESLGHGVSHLADVVAADPSREELIALIDAYAEAGGGLEELLPGRDGQLYFATEALRAYAWLRSGRLEEAVDLLVQVARAKPDVRYLDAWVLPAVGEGLGVLPPALGLHLLGSVLSSIPANRKLIASRAPAARAWARLACDFWQRAPLDGDLRAMADMVVPGICRKAGLFDEGLQIAEAAIRARPSWNAHVARGLLLRASGAIEEARACFEDAIRLQPRNDSTYLEAGDTFFENDRWEEARQYDERALALDSAHPWALPSALFCQWRERFPHERFPNDAYPQELYALMREGNHRAHGVYDAFRAFIGFVPEPFDATTNVIRQIVQQSPPNGEAGGRLTTALTDVEAPSNAVLMRFLYGGRRDLEISYSNVAEPDPRLPHQPIAYTLWRLDGETVVPALPPPSPRITDVVRRLASRRFRVAEAWAQASWAAAELGVDDVEPLLACIVHPPPMPEGSPPERAFAWIPRVQLTVTFVLAHLRRDEPWEASVRRRALLSILHGPMDWSTESAVVALTRVAHEDPCARMDIHRAFARLDAARPSSGGVPWEQTLLAEWRWIPGLYEQEQQQLEERLRALRD